MDSLVLFQDDANKIKEYLKIHPEDINIVFDDITPLVNALWTQRVDVIDCLIENGCDINFQNIYGRTALHRACNPINTMRNTMRNVNRDIIERLISNGASGLLKNSNDYTPLHFAAMYAKDVNIIHQLLIISDPNSLNERGENPLMHACSLNISIEIISALLNVTHDINLQNNYGQTALHHSCYYKRNEAIKLLLSSGADSFIQDNRGRTPYDLADEKGKRIIDEYSASRK